MKLFKSAILVGSKSARRVVTLLAAITLFAAGGLAHAAQNQPMQGAPQRLEQIPVETYHYGMKLDIARVLSNSDTSQECGVVPSIMHYEDSSGTPRALEYLIYGGGCSDN